MPAAAPFDCTFVTRPQPRDGADYLYRTCWPAMALAEHIPTTSIQLSHPQCLDAMASTGLLVVTMVMENDLVAVLDFRRARGLPTIYEVSDDFESFPENLPLCKFYEQPWVQQLARELCQKADAVQFSSPGLARKFGALNPTHKVLHNQAWDVPAPVRRGQQRPLQVGWAGMAGHYEDCAELVEFLQPSFGRNAPHSFRPKDLELTVMTTPRIAEALTAAGIRFAWKAPGSMEEYGRFLDQLDIGIGFTAERDFSRSRSDGKFIEYATHGVVAVCSNRGTYAETVRHLETGVLYGTPEQLRIELEALTRHPERVAALRANAYEELRETRNHRAAARDRLAFYCEIVEGVRTRRPGAARVRSRLAPGRGHLHAVHEIEDEFQAALMQHREAPSGDLLARYWQLAQRVPDFYRVWEVLLKAYQQLGLTENLEALKQRATRTKELAFQRAFGTSV